MTSDQQRLADDKMRAEIARMSAEVAKLMAETSKINREFQWYPFVLLTAAVAATATIVKLFF